MLVTAMAIIAKYPVGDRIDFLGVKAEAAKASYLEVGKCLFSIEAELGREGAKKAILAGKRVTEHTIKNARQAAQVWADVVEAGHADEAWFDKLTYMDCVAINRAIAKATVKLCVEDGLFKKSPAAAHAGFELLAETGKTQAMRLADEEAAKEAAAKKTSIGASNPSAAPESSTQAASVNPAAAGKTPRAEKALDVAALEKIEAAEKAVLSLIELSDEVTIERIQVRLVAMRAAVEVARTKRASSTARQLQTA